MDRQILAILLEPIKHDLGAAAGIECASNESGRIVPRLVRAGTGAALTQTLAKIRARALASALVALVVNLIGAELGPLTVGFSSDLLANSFAPTSIRYALLF